MTNPFYPTFSISGPDLELKPISQGHFWICAPLTGLKECPTDTVHYTENCPTYTVHGRTDGINHLLFTANVLQLHIRHRLLEGHPAPGSFGGHWQYRRLSACSPTGTVHSILPNRYRTLHCILPNRYCTLHYIAQHVLYIILYIAQQILYSNTKGTPRENPFGVSSRELHALLVTRLK